MIVSVRLFAMAKQRGEADTVTVNLPESATIAQLKGALAEAVPALVPLLPSLRFAINAEYVTDSDAIVPGAEIAAIPPVSGGSSSAAHGPSAPERARRS